MCCGRSFTRPYSTQRLYLLAETAISLLIDQQYSNRSTYNNASSRNSSSSINNRYENSNSNRSTYNNNCRSSSSITINRATTTTTAAPITTIAAAKSVGTSTIATETTKTKAITSISITLAPNDRIYGRDRCFKDAFTYLYLASAPVPGGYNRCMPAVEHSPRLPEQGNHWSRP